MESAARNGRYLDCCPCSQLLVIELWMDSQLYDVMTVLLYIAIEIKINLLYI